MSDSNTATIRTTVSALVIFFVAWVISKVTGKAVDTNDPSIILWGTVVFGVLYRLFLVISENVPYAGYILFGINRKPEYTTPPPAVPALADEDKGDISNSTLYALAAVAIIVVAIIWCIQQFT